MTKSNFSNLTNLTDQTSNFTGGQDKLSDSSVWILCYNESQVTGNKSRSYIQYNIAYMYIFVTSKERYSISNIINSLHNNICFVPSNYLTNKNMWVQLGDVDVHVYFQVLVCFIVGHMGKHAFLVSFLWKKIKNKMARIMNNTTFPLI